MSSTAELRRSTLLCCAIVATAVLSACGGGAPRDLSRDEARLVAWWCEDWSRGIARESGELRTVGGSVALNRIADWVDTRDTTATRHHLTARLQRWAVVRSFIANGELQTTDDGLLMLAPEATGDTATLAQRIADAENRDRRTVEVLCLTFAQTDDTLTRQLKEAFRAARRAGDATARGVQP